MRRLHLLGLGGAVAIVLSACAAALDFGALTSGNGSDASSDAGTDTTPDSRNGDAPADAPADTARDAVEEYAVNPCAKVGNASSGLYCGRTTQNGFSGGDPTVLYDCENGAVLTSQSCPDGCFIAPSGYEDECDDCSGQADGRYCGSQFGYAAPSSHLLVACQSGHVSDAGLIPCVSGVCVVDGGLGACGP